MSCIRMYFLPPTLVAVWLAVCGDRALAQSPESSGPSEPQPVATGEPHQHAVSNVDPSLPLLRAMIERYQEDRRALSRSFAIPMSPLVRRQMQAFYQKTQDELGDVSFEPLPQDQKVDYLLFREQLRYELEELNRQQQREQQIAEWLPFATPLITLEEQRRLMRPINARETADLLATVALSVQSTQQKLEGALRDAAPLSAVLARRLVRQLESLRGMFDRWYRFYSGYDPQFTWWVKNPYADVTRQLDDYTNLIRQRIVEPGGGPENLIGDPIGEAALLAELRREWIPYGPAQLIEIANREFAWCEAELMRATRELGFGDDWRGAMEHVKQLHVEPGRQPELIRELAVEAIAFLDQRQLLTIPSLCRETWRMEMMSPERQRTSPYFLGGETIIVSFPTDDMAHADKLMSMRGNNRHFARATVHHELIPGHHLQGFMADRYRQHRQAFATPFLVEGWALYWEMLLWDLDFAQSPEDRIGMLFWRMHRCARIIFSLNFHLGRMTAEEAVEFLVQRVGHERNNATAEVRRSIAGDYGPLYQAAYMLGGLQLRALRGELVESGRMTDREFHDAVLRENSISIELIRASLTHQTLTPEFRSQWKFYGDL